VQKAVHVACARRQRSLKAHRANARYDGICTIQ
jgi:hypothetical protein